MRKYLALVGCLLTLSLAPVLADQVATDESTDKELFSEQSDAFVNVVHGEALRALFFSNSGNLADPYMITRYGNQCTTLGDATDLQTLLGLNVYGFSCRVASPSTNIALADNFLLCEEWALDQLVFYAYQTGTFTNPTINRVDYAILATNPLGQLQNTITFTTVSAPPVSFVNVYKKRDIDADPNECTRRVQQVTVNLSPPLVLPAGQYWLVWRMGGTSTSGPWHLPVVVPGATQKPGSNAMQSTTLTGAFAYVIDSGTAQARQDMSFLLGGTMTGIPAGRGACCLGTGACVPSLCAAECTALAGTYMGDDSVCDPSPCITGACCFANGSCQTYSPDYCLAQGGVYQGDGTVCDPNPCPQPDVRCCFPDGSCQMLITAVCIAAGGAPGTYPQNCDPVFGYNALTCGNAFEDISADPNSIALTLPDDNGVSVPLNFTFNFYGAAKTTVAVCSNGYLTFAATGWTALTEVAIPNTAVPNDLIAVLWDDYNPTLGGTIHYRTDGTAGNLRFIAQWKDIRQYSNTDLNTFQAILYEADGCIELRYGAFTPRTADYRAGVENATGTAGLDVTTMVTQYGCIEICPGYFPVCPQPGACCFPDGTCEVLLQPDCTALFGVYLGAGTLCEPDICPPPCITCPPFGIVEGEPVCGNNYVDTYNGGCNSVPPVFQPISLGDTICGYSGTFLVGATQSRDTDWFEVGITQPTRLIWTATGTFAIQIFVIDGNSGCPTGGPAIIASATANACAPATITTPCLQPGVYWLWVGPQVFTGISCLSPYVATVSTIDCLGACCFQDGTCVPNLLPADCLAQGGEFVGPSTDCGNYWTYQAAPCANAFEDISTDPNSIALTLPDDNGVSVPLNFTFNFYGVAKTTVAVCSNGYLTFAATGWTTLTEVAIPNTAVPNDLIAVLWDDYNPTLGGTIHYRTDGTAGNRRFIAQWKDIRQYGNTDLNTFQAILYEADGCVELRYGAFTPRTADYRAGVENATGTAGLDVTTMVTQNGCISLCPIFVPNPCPPGAACCIGTVCQYLTEAACLTAGGVWKGAGTDCFPNPCLPPPMFWFDPVGDQGGDGYEDTWYLYPNFSWWNMWWPNEFSLTRQKVIDVSIDFWFPIPGSVIVALNWATPPWTDLGLLRPPLPGDVMDPNLENLYIGRYILAEVNSTQYPMGGHLDLHYVLPFCPEWVSMDVWGPAFQIQGTITHICLPPADLGACCLDYAGACQVLSEADCLAAGGRFRGVGTDCSNPAICGCKGDCNCDGVVDFDDINPFVAALSGGMPCSYYNCDIDDSGLVDFDDINPFVGLLSAGAVCP